jgi:hypothetical protein
LTQEKGFGSWLVNGTVAPAEKSVIRELGLLPWFPCLHTNQYPLAWPFHYTKNMYRKENMEENPRIP